MRLAARAWVMAVALIFFACGSVYAQQECGVEVKVLLSPRAAAEGSHVAQAKGETPGNNYFYDTPQLELLSQGLILRLRAGTEKDLTVKLRPSADKKFNGSSVAGDRFKCEGEIVDGGGEQFLFGRDSVCRGSCAGDGGAIAGPAERGTEETAGRLGYSD